MKAYLILCFLLASLLFFPSSLLAQELAADAGKGGTGGTGNPNKPSKPLPCGKYNRRGCRPPKNSGP
ncbi:hypothetical protein TIFTF001_026793 [Ficus carica]|uniref:Uncharacterized protein n=1 Tax=Ficus carica TaxID=3494 RepID=A0AA88DLU5_FICCA|nr:hypothetical protein TIFTF001_026793 [Ficus carica]